MLYLLHINIFIYAVYAVYLKYMKYKWYLHVHNKCYTTNLIYQYVHSYAVNAIC